MLLNLKCLIRVLRIPDRNRQKYIGTLGKVPLIIHQATKNAQQQISFTAITDNSPAARFLMIPSNSLHKTHSLNGGIQQKNLVSFPMMILLVFRNRQKQLLILNRRFPLSPAQRRSQSTNSVISLFPMDRKLSISIIIGKWRLIRIKGYNEVYIFCPIRNPISPYLIDFYFL